MSSEAPVTEVAVTYSMVPPGDDYTRAAKIPSPAYLWVKRDAKATPLTAVALVYDDAALPEGFVKIPQDLIKSAPDKSVFLCVSTDSDKGSPILAIASASEEEPVPGAGFVKLETDATHGTNESSVFLFYKTEQSEGASSELEIGDYVDVLDTVSKWCVGRVADKNDGQVFVNFVGWSDKWNEWIALGSKRLAIYRTHTRGQDTGPIENDRAFKLSGKNLSDFKAHVESLDTILKKQSDGKDLTKEELTTLQIENPKWINNIMRAVVPNMDDLPIAAAFLNTNIQYIAQLLSEAKAADVDTAYMEAFVRIFDGDSRSRRFYTKYGLDPVKNKKASGDWATPPKRGTVSAHLIRNVNLFGAAGGFTAILLCVKEPHISMHSVRLIVRALFSVAKYIVPKKLAKLVTALAPLVFGRLRVVSDDELKTLDRQALQTLVQHLEDLMEAASMKHIARDVEAMYLDLSLRLMQSKLLEKRINGVMELKANIDRVIRKENPHLARSRQEAAVYLSTEFMLEWIESNNVVEILLGPGSHPEIIKRSPPILKFLAHHHQLKAKHLDMLWGSSIDKHESLVMVVYDTIAELATELSPKHLKFLFEKKISAKELSSHNEISLNFLKKFTTNAMRHGGGGGGGGDPGADEESSSFGLDIFWQLIQDESKAADEVVELAHDMLVDLLAIWEFHGHRLLYVEKCVKNLSDGRSVPETLRLLQSIIESFPVRAPGVGSSLTLESLLQQMQEKSGLLDLLLRDMQEYGERAKKLRMTGDLPSAGRHSHDVQLDTRLTFLEFVLSNADICIEKEHIGVLWDCMMPADEAKLLGWLRTARTDVHGRYYDVLMPDTSEFIFERLLCNERKLQYSTLSAEGFECFRTFFLYVNHADGVLEATRAKNLVVTNFDKLQGLQPLWKIAATTHDRLVARAAGEFLISLHVRIDAQTHKSKDVSKMFVSTAMNLLRQALDNKEAHSDDTIIGIVQLLEHFLIALDTTDLDEEDAASRPRRGARVLLKVVVLEKGDKALTSDVEIEVTLQPHHQIGSMRQELAKHIEWPASQIKFVYHNRILYPEEYDTMTVAEARIHGARNDRILAYKMDPDDDLSRPPDDSGDNVYPRVLLANEKEYFDLLFELLRLGGRVGQEVWRLLSRLPTNQELATNVNTLNVRDADGKPDWGRLFDPSAVLKLFYSLQLVEAKVSSNKSDSDKHVEKWCTTFLAEGGFQHLYNILTHLDLDVIFQEALPQHCLGVLVKLINFFLQGRFRHETLDVAKNFFDFAAVAKRLIGVLDKGVQEKKKGDPNALLSPTSAAVDAALGPESAAVASASAAAAAEIDSDDDAPPPPPPPPRQHQPQEGEAGVLAGGGEVSASQLVGAFVVTEAMQLITACCQMDKKVLREVFFADPRLDSIVLRGLVKNAVPQVRQAMQEGIDQLCVRLEVPDTRLVLLPKLLDMLPHIDTKSTSCTEYFDTIKFLLAGANSDELPFDVETLSRDLAEKITSHPIVEVRSTDFDAVLRGMLDLTTELVRTAPSIKEPLGQDHGLVDELFDHCLFAVPSVNRRGVIPPPKCKSPRLRKSAFDLLAELARDCAANYDRLAELIVPNHMTPHSGGLNPKDWDFEPSAEEKSIAGYVGMKNLGCICYMNSLVQQIFMVPQLRGDLLAIEEKDVSNEEKEDSFLYQLQHIMAFLQESERMYVNPGGFTHAFKDWDGNPTNVHVQMDSQEFLNMLFDRIDTKVKGTPHEKALKRSLGGIASNELICKGCPHYKEREEEFYHISLNVKNKKTLQESLEDFVAGEMLEGDNAYMCGKCNKKVDTLKRVVLKRLPPTIIFHLKRFEFNFDTMQKVKLNTRLEFPQRINLKPYSKQALSDNKNRQSMETPDKGDEEDGEDEDGKGAGEGKDAEAEEEETFPDLYYEYELSGVLVHMGSADRGHYYSFIKERLSDNEIRDGVDPKWIEFNDAIVKPFDPRRIPDECFGGEEVRRHWADVAGYGGGSGMGVTGRGATQDVTVEKYRNAYLLFYDRVRDVERVDPPRPPVLNRQRSASQFVDVPPKIFKNIWEQNVTYWRDKAVYDVDYFKFVWDFVRLNNDKTSLRVTELATRFVFETLSRAKHKEDFHSWLDLLHDMYSRKEACEWLASALSDRSKGPSSWSSDFLFECRVPEVRQRIGGLFCHVMDTLGPDSEVLHAWGLSLSRLLREAPSHWKRFEHYFRVLAHYAGLSHKTAAKLVEEEKLVSRLVDFYLGDESPHPEVGDMPVDSKGRRRRMGDEWGNRPDYTFFLMLLRNLVAGPPPNDDDEEAKQLASSSSSEPPPLSDMDVRMVTGKSFMSQMLLEASTRKRGQFVSAILCHFARENSEFTERVIGFISEGIEENTVDDVRPYFRSIMSLCKLEDSLQDTRIHHLLSSLLGVMAIQRQYWKITQLCIEHLVRIAKCVPKCYDYLHKSGDKLNFILDFLAINPRPPGYGSDPNVHMYKPQREVAQQGWSERPYTSHVAMSSRQKHAAIEAIKNGEPLEADSVSDSDEDLNDRVFEAGQWVDCQDTVSAWCRATVVHTKGDRVLIHYDGWPSRWDEYVHVGSSRIAPFGRFTGRMDQAKLKGKGPKPGDNLGQGRVFNPEDDELAGAGGGGGVGGGGGGVDDGFDDESMEDIYATAQSQ